MLVTVLLAVAFAYFVVALCGGFQTARAATTTVYYVDVFRCPGAGDDVTMRFDGENPAVDQYGESTAWQASHTATSAQVRIRKGTAGTGVTYLVALRNKTCAGA